MAHKRIAILWTIVIVFISQLFHCAYTNPREQGTNSGLSQQRPQIQQQQQQPRHYSYNHEPQQQEEVDQLQQQPFQHHRETYEELLSSSSDSADTNQDTQVTTGQQETSTRERCRELISLTLLSFKDLSQDERASEEIDCANLREQISAAANRNNHQQRPRQQLTRAQQTQEPQHAQDATPATQLPLDDFPLSPIYSRDRPPQASSQSVTNHQSLVERQNTRQYQPFVSADDFTSYQSSWQPKNSYVNQMQQLLIQQQINRKQSQHQQDDQPFLQFYRQLQPTTITLPPTTQATTFESIFETTMPSTTTTTTTTTPSPAQLQPRIKIGPGKRRMGAKSQARSSTTTTTTTTTTPIPSTLADYADGSEVSTDYYDEYEDQAQATTTTTTTTARPNRPRAGRKPKRQRFSTTSTSPKPSTTSTTLSPGYQPRPDGRIIDYMADPNFPRELKGADLTNYPFYISVPEKIDFECKGRHDGYYTNIDLHCQIYHHCAVGNRYDFLCPNYTLFDQTTFTCRFINTVDCVGSAKHFDRNNALYVEKNEKDSSASVSSSTSTTTTTTTTTTTQAPKLDIQLSRRSGLQQQINTIKQMASNSAGSSTPASVSALSIVMQHSGLQPTGGASNRNKRTINR